MKKVCAKCKRPSKLWEFRDLDRLVYICAECMDALVWHWVSANPSAPVHKTTTKALEKLFRL